MPPLPEERRSFSLFNIKCFFLIQGYLEEVEMERYMKVLEQNQQNNVHVNFAATRKAMKKGEFPLYVTRGVSMKICRILVLKYVCDFL